MGEPERVAEQIHEQWPFIPEKEALDFYHSLGAIQISEGTIRITLWVLKRVIEHKLEE